MGFTLKNHRPLRVGLAVAIVGMLNPPGAYGQTAEDLQRDLKAMKVELQQLQEKMKKQEELIERLSKQKGGAPAEQPAVGAAPAPAPAAAAPAADQEQLERRLTENIMRKIQPSLTAANKTFPSQFNPAIGLIIDSAASFKEHEREQLRVPRR